jgi:hypothetical protein
MEKDMRAFGLIISDMERVISFSLLLKYFVGKFWFSYGSVYDGDWLNDKEEGYGVLIQQHGKYEGMWKNGQQHGQGINLFLFFVYFFLGIETSDDGTYYKGTFKDGMKDGKGSKYPLLSELIGTERFEDEGTYSGQWKNNQMNGFVRQIYSNS